jgi:Ca2+-binding EF-hand superfamily protein
MKRSVACLCLLALAAAVGAQAPAKEKNPAGAKDAKPAAPRQEIVTRAELTARAKLEEAFGRYDKNQDGVLTRDEFPGSPEQFGNLDRNRNSNVTKLEFTRSPLARRFLERDAADERPARERFAPPADREALRPTAWAHLDRDRDGRVARDEWTGTAQAFQVLDRNADGVLDRRDVTAEPVASGREPAGPQLTGPPLQGGVAELMARHDRNQDGRISRTEAGGVRLGRLFDAIDTDRSGELSEAELQTAVYALGRMAAERDRGGPERRSQRSALTFDAWDRDRDGRLTTGEFRGPGELFPLIDRNRDAVLSREEVATFLREQNEVEFLKKYDGNGDGRVTRDEFPGTDEVFRRADRSGDGTVTAADR